MKLVPLRPLALCVLAAGVFASIVTVETHDAADEPREAAAAAPASSASRCISLEGAEFCHAMQMTRLRQGQIPGGDLRIRFDFKGHRSCEVGDRLWRFDYSVHMAGFSEDLMGDYPDLVSRILRSNAIDRDDFGPTGFAMTHIDMTLGNQISVEDLDEVFGISGFLFRSGLLIVDGYPTLAGSISGCQGLARERNG